MAGSDHVSKETKNDVRVIIDVSGSMKKNDPDNLRIPALKLLIGLLPQGTKAGVWTFGTKVRPLVKYGVVNEKWKKKAYKAAKKITSRDMFTDVENALSEVTKDWKQTRQDIKRNIIFLTDGMVDVSKDKSKTEASRQRILDQILPDLQGKSVTVHAISLSENADLEIMDALAVGTDGSSEMVTRADQLQRVFLHMFEKSTPRDTVPLEDNQFTIDKMIEEFTLLVFRNSDSKPTTLFPPEGNPFAYESRPKNAVWLKEQGYDLITIKHPVPGLWKIDADIDPDNRVMVVTKLKLHATELPNSLFKGETLDYKFWLTAAGKKIAKNAFYKLIDVELVQSSSGEIKEVWKMEERNGENEFVKTVGNTFEPGKVELKIIVDGKTFKRELKKTIDVYEKAFDTEIKAFDETTGKQAYVIHVIPDNDLIDLKTFKVTAHITAPDGLQSSLPGVVSMRGINWLITIKDPQPGQYKVDLEVKATTKSGRKLSLASDSLTVGEPVSQDAENGDESSKEEAVDWKTIGTYLAIFNTVLFILIGGFWFLMKKRKSKPTDPGDDL